MKMMITLEGAQPHVPKFLTSILFIFISFLGSTLGQGLQTSTYPAEVIFSIALAVLGLILFALLIGNMQVTPYFMLLLRALEI